MLNIGVVNYNGYPFIEMLYRSIQKTISSDCPFQFNVCDNGSNPDEIKKLKHLAQESGFRLLHRQQDNALSISFSHAASIDFLIGKMHETSDRIMIVDYDCFFIQKNWNVQFEKLLRRGAFVCTTSKIRASATGPFIYYGQSSFSYIIRKHFYPSIGHRGQLKSQKKDTGYRLAELNGWMRLLHVKTESEIVRKGLYEIRLPNKSVVALHLGEARECTGTDNRYNSWMEYCQKQLLT